MLLTIVRCWVAPAIAEDMDLTFVRQGGCKERLHLRALSHRGHGLGRVDDDLMIGTSLGAIDVVRG